MVTKFIAIITIMTLMLFNTLGNFWYTYGIWPRSWAAFAGFWFCGLVLYIAMQIVTTEKK